MRAIDNAARTASRTRARAAGTLVSAACLLSSAMLCAARAAETEGASTVPVPSDNASSAASATVALTVCNKLDQTLNVAVVHPSGDRRQSIAEGWFAFPAQSCKTKSFPRGKFLLYANAFDAVHKLNMQWTGPAANAFCVSNDRFNQVNVTPPCPNGERAVDGATLIDLTNRATWTQTYNPPAGIHFGEENPLNPTTSEPSQ